MRSIVIAGHIVEIYDAIDELPINRFHKYNKMLLIDSGIGSDLNDFNTHVSRVAAFIQTDKAQALLELENIRQSLYLVSQEISPIHLAFIPLIAKIDGKPLKDLSDENIKRWHKEFGDAPVGWFQRLIQSVKKKIDDELSLYFPGQFDDAGIKEYFDRMRERILLQLDSIIRNNDNEMQINKIGDLLLTHARPQVFSGRESAEIKYDKQFDEMCTFLIHRINVNPDKMTVLQFYNSFEYIKKSNKQNRAT